MAPLEWQDVGPKGAAPRARGFAFDAKRGYTYVAISGTKADTGTTAIYRSEDGGLTWSPSNQGFGDNRLFHDVFVDPTNGVVFASPSGANMAFPKMEMYRSVDFGQTWQPAMTGLSPNIDACYRFARDPISGAIFAGCGYGRLLQHTTNLGLSWQETGATWPTNPAPMTFGLAVGSTGIIYLGAAGTGLLVSGDGGKSYTTTVAGLPPTPVIRSPAFGPGNVVYLPLQSGTQGGVYRSLDGGMSFTRMGPDPALAVTTSVVVDCKGRLFAAGYSGIKMTITPTDGVYFSANQGQSWKQMNAGLVNPRIDRLAISPDNRLYAGVNEMMGGPVFRSAPICCP
jgi:photosystem II stability/assembly factor-like uncharacterized protein